MTGETSPLPTTILRDTREQRPWTFDGCGVETRGVTLSIGDDAVPTCCTRDTETDTYRPAFAIERRSGHDFLTSLTWDRDRFRSELRRASDWERPLSVVVEASWETLLRSRGPMAWRDVHPNQMVGTVSAWSRQFNVGFRFTESRLEIFLHRVANEIVAEAVEYDCSHIVFEDLILTDENPGIFACQYHSLGFFAPVRISK